MNQFFLTFALILGTVIVALGVMKVFKQPMIIGYIIAGTLITFLFPGFFQPTDGYANFSQIGISFLLFIVGMELNPAMLKRIGFSTVLLGLAQVIVITVLGFWVSLLLGFDLMTSFYLGFGLSLSSTIVVQKLLADKNDVDTIYGRQVVGILVVQDVVVMLFMLVMATLGSFEGNAAVLQVLGFLLLKLVGLALGLSLITKYILPSLTKKIAESQEFLFLFSIAWCFGMASIFYLLGLGLEIGTLVAGITLATSPYRFEITSKIKVLKDFFIVIYFVLLGSQISFSQPIDWGIILIFLFVVLFVKPYIIMRLMDKMKHSKRNNFFTGMALAQFSEFSFIILSGAIAGGIIPSGTLLTSLTIAGILSIVFSSYFTIYNYQLYKKLPRWLKEHIPGARSIEHDPQLGKKNDMIILGYGKIGSNLYEHFSKKYDILIVDDHPKIINYLNTKNINCLFGDGMDLEFLKSINVEHTKMVVSTIKDLDINFALIKAFKDKKPDLIIIPLAHHIHEALSLYEKGADFVLIPHYVGLDHTSLMLEEFGFDIEKFLKNKPQQVEILKHRSNDLLLEELLKN